MRSESLGKDGRLPHRRRDGQSQRHRPPFRRRAVHTGPQRLGVRLLLRMQPPLRLLSEPRHRAPEERV